MPNIDDCENDYIRCKSTCFVALVKSLAEAGGDAQMIDAAKERYKTCRSLCKAAQAICNESSD